MEIWSSDDAKILDLGSMMVTQDNPERISQIYQSKKITLLEFHYKNARYADLNLDPTNRWLKYVTRSDLSFKV